MIRIESLGREGIGHLGGDAQRPSHLHSPWNPPMFCMRHIWILWYMPPGLCHHAGCRWLGTKYAPGHQQPQCWLDRAYGITCTIACSRQIALQLSTKYVTVGWRNTNLLVSLTQPMRKCGCNFKWVIFKLMWRIIVLISWVIRPRWMPDFTYD